MDNKYSFFSSSSTEPDSACYDENFNPVHKLEFENQLAWYLIHSPGEQIKRVVHKASLKVWEYVGKHLKAAQGEDAQAFQKIILEEFRHQQGAETFQYFRFEPGTSETNFVDWIEKTLNDPEANPIQKMRLNLVIANIYMECLKKFPDERETIRPFNQWDSDILYKFIKPEYYFANRREQRKEEDAKAFKQGRNENEDKAGPLLTTQFGIFARNSKFERNKRIIQEHVRGGDVQYVPTKGPRNYEGKNQFLKNARDVLDMPLVCGTASTIAQSLHMSLLFYDLTPEEFRYYFLAHMAYNIAGGHHTFYECAALLEIAGLPYEEGDYTSVFPQEFILNPPADPEKPNQSWLQSLSEQFPDLFPIDLKHPKDPEFDAHLWQIFYKK